MIRGIRGATTVEQDTEEEVLAAVDQLMTEIIAVNEIDPNEVASVFVSATDDIHSVFPAKGLRSREGWKYVPVTCMAEMDVEHALTLCIRIMLHVNTIKSQQEIHHIYQAGAVVLRPDLTN